jgi:hypothetical protein
MQKMYFIDLGVVLKAFNISLIFLELHLFLFFLCEFSSMPDGLIVRYFIRFIIFPIVFLLILPVLCISQLLFFIVHVLHT